MAIASSSTSSTETGGLTGASPDRGWIHVGRVGKPHGLDGSFLVSEANPAMLQVGVSVTIAGVARVVERRAGHEGRVILRLAGCTDRAAAEGLRGQAVLAARELAPDLEEDEWWAEDLEGCAVRDGDRTVGTVTRLLALPSCEVLEVERSGGGDPLLVPLVSDAVREVDLKRREIDVDLTFLGES
jgi:16S rRNA processing protein RimM